MFVIMAYDVNVSRVTKALNICRKYLTRIQNSVFEGELTKSQYESLKSELKNLINEEEDSVILYHIRRREYSGKEVIGQCKGDSGNFII